MPGTSEPREDQAAGAISRPAGRAWNVPSVALSDYVHLDAAWRRSRQMWQGLAQALESLPPHPLVETVAVSGSLGRMEYQSRSDVDLVIVLSGTAYPNDRLVETAFESVWESLGPLDLKRPRRHGVYNTPATQRTLCDPARFGKVDEDLPTFGKRIQLLLDCQPVFRPRAFESLIGEVIGWYQQGMAEDSPRRWEYLLHDLARYFHAVAISCAGSRSDEPATWRLRNLKRLYSRRVIHAGLLLLLGQYGLSAGDDQMFRSLLALTPLERVGHVFAEYGENSAFRRIASSYDTFLGSMDDPTFQAALASPVESSEEWERHAEYAALRENAQTIARELIDFLNARRGQWSDGFFESLLF